MNTRDGNAALLYVVKCVFQKCELALDVNLGIKTYLNRAAPTVAFGQISAAPTAPSQTKTETLEGSERSVIQVRDSRDTTATICQTTAKAPFRCSCAGPLAK